MNENLAICSICNKKLKSINSAHLKTHGLDLKEYNILFGLNYKTKNICSYEYHNPDKRYKDLLNFKCKFLNINSIGINLQFLFYSSLINFLTSKYLSSFNKNKTFLFCLLMVINCKFCKILRYFFIVL